MKIRLLGYFAGSIGKSLRTFRSALLHSIFRIKRCETDFPQDMHLIRSIIQGFPCRAKEGDQRRQTGLPVSGLRNWDSRKQWKGARHSTVRSGVLIWEVRGTDVCRALSTAFYYLPKRSQFSELLLNGTDLSGQPEVSQSPNLLLLHGGKKNCSHQEVTICQCQLSSSSSSLSDDRFKASSKTIPPHTAIQSFLLQMTVSSSVLKVIQQLLTSSSLSYCHFYLTFYLSFNNLF